MEVMETIRKRCSVRSYTKDPVPPDVLEQLLEAARLAPSARNLHHRKYIVIENPGKDPAFVNACNNQSCVAEAAVVIVGVVDPAVTKWADIDLAIAFEHIVLEAVELGLGTCWIGAFEGEKIKQLLGVPDDKKVVALLTLGYPRGEASQKSKAELSLIWAKEKYMW